VIVTAATPLAWPVSSAAVMPPVTHDPNQLKAGRMTPGPGHQRLTDHRIQQVLPRPPGLGQVVFNVAHCHPLRDDIEHPQVAIVHQQDPLGIWMGRPAVGQQFRAGHGLHRLVTDN
jgi:hypothetical protein